MGRMLALLWPRREAGLLRLRVVVAILLVVAGKLAGVGVPLAYKALIDAFSSEAVWTIPLVLILAYGVASLSAQITGDLRQLVFAAVAQRAIRVTALEVFRHLHQLSMRFHIERRMGALSRIVERGTVSIEFLLELSLFNIAPTALELVLVCSILWSFYSPDFALVTLVSIAAYTAFTAVVTRSQVEFRREMNRREIVASARAADSIMNYETVKYFSAEAHEAHVFDQARRSFESAAIRSQAVQSALTIGQAVIVTSGSLALMWMASRRVVAGTMSVGDFVLVNAYLLQLYAPLNSLALVYGSVRQALTDIEALSHLLTQPVEVFDSPNAASLRVDGGGVQFEQVSFSYEISRPVLKELSFEIPAGSTVALVGPTGGGKSTVARLLFRFYDPTEGRILIDGQDIRLVSQDSLRRSIGVVPQDTVLFNDTLFSNIAYGRPDATRAEVEGAARAAHIHRFIESLPDAYETQVGERGLKLSGGERQRIAIARAILKNPAILVFDEATSALDNATEREIQHSLNHVSARRSTLIIAHRLSTIVHADEILVIDAGRILERGRHLKLLAAGGVYARLWSQEQQAAGTPGKETADALKAIGAG